MIEKVLKSIRRDRERGGIELALMLLEGLRHVENPEDFVTEIKNLRPDMAVFLNIAHYLSHIDKDNVKNWIDEQIEGIKNLPERLGKRVKENIGKIRAITTISRSRSVLIGIQALKPERIYILRGYPLNDGKRMVEDVEGITEPVLLEDLNMVDGLRMSDCVLIGADCISPDGFVNRKGSLPLCIVANYLRIPVYVVSEELKVVNNFCEVREDIFEYIPSSLVTQFITEEREWKPFIR
ncbi:hypothetical protein DRQ17_05425 [bacterium]|nr:MAG: hypothetical protein DRQ17_05425 [bacterium]RKZ24056.1 MAG: hypothetical protein DRQ23_01300 [bacterium]